MLDNRFQKTLFHLTSVLTAFFPRAGAKFFDTLLPPIIGNRFLVRQVLKKNIKTIGEISQFKRILVIPDIHIGDALFMQATVSAFRDFFPEAQIDYVCKKAVACLIEGNPDISNLYPIFTGTVFPSDSDIEAIQKIASETPYDLCFNGSPFFEDDQLFPEGQKILNFMSVAPLLVRNDIDRTGINHFLFQAYQFPARLLSSAFSTKRTLPFNGIPVILSDQAVAEAQALLQSVPRSAEQPIVFLNPDTASPYTRIPFEQQLALLKGLAQLKYRILLGSAFTAKGIEQQLIDALKPSDREYVSIVPTSLSLDGYAALIDFTDVFISGDTGPLHIGAARKFSKSGNFKFQNKTFVVSVFGATPARMSGYDSTNPLFPPSNQDTASRTYVSESPCRNITCVNKMVKTCKVVRCFEVLDTAAIVAEIQAHLSAFKTAN